MDISGGTSLFVSQVRARAEKLIDKGIWVGVERSTLSAWLGQFEAYDAELLGAVVLDNLLLRSKAQLLSLMESAFTHPALTRDLKHDYELAQALGRKAEPHVRVIPAISFEQPPTKSGPYVLRQVQRYFRMRADWLIWPHTARMMPESIERLIIVDDFIGSGEQFKEFSGHIGLESLMAERSTLDVIYLAAAGTTTGIKAIRDVMPRVQILVADILTDRHNLFDQQKLEERYRQKGLTERLVESHASLIKSVGLPTGGKLGPMGFGGLGLTYGFEHGTPNNSLPLLWYESEQWKPLLAR